jgi:hypothetical protein
LLIPPNFSHNNTAASYKLAFEMIQDRVSRGLPPLCCGA